MPASQYVAESLDNFYTRPWSRKCAEEIACPADLSRVLESKLLASYGTTSRSSALLVHLSADQQGIAQRRGRLSNTPSPSSWQIAALRVCLRPLSNTGKRRINISPVLTPAILHLIYNLHSMVHPM